MPWDIMDIWVAVSESNAVKMVEALKEFGISVPELQMELFLEERKIIRMGIPPMRLEIFTGIDGITFEQSYKNREIADFGSFKVNFISKQDLMKNKRASGRPQDLTDYEKLRGKAKNRNAGG